MRTLVLGGAGECGRHLTWALSKAPEIDRITLADVDIAAARRVAEDVSSNSIEVVHLDLRDTEALTERARTADCLVNCTPFSFFDAVIHTAIEARVNYVDLISEPNGYHRKLARDAGIVAISGLGMSPGTTNVLCAHAATDFDELRECHINFASIRTIAPSEGLLDTILWELGNDCPTRHIFHDGRFIRTPPLEGSHLVEFPQPVGVQRVFIMPHTETRTLPRNFPKLRHVAVRGTWNPELMQEIGVLNKYGLLDDVPLGPGLPTSFAATKKRIWEKFGGQRDSVPEWSSFAHVEVLGGVNGEFVQRTYEVSHDRWGTEAVGKTAGVHAAVGVRLLARHGDVRGGGFIDPEMYFDPNEYVAELEKVPGVRLTWSDTTPPVSGDPYEQVNTTAYLMQDGS